MFIASLVKEIYLAVSSSYKGVDFFCEFVGRQTSCGFNTKILSVCLRSKPGFYFFSLHKIQMSKQHRLSNLTISYQAGPNLEKSKKVFYLFYHGKNWKVQPRATFKIPVVNLCANNVGEIIFSLTSKFKNIGKTEGIYVK